MYNERPLFSNGGVENYAQGRPFRLGMWVSGVFSWIEAPEWQRTLEYEEGAFVARIELKNRELGIELSIRDAVDFHENLYGREIVTKNLSRHYIDCRLFSYRYVRICGIDFGNTAYFKPEAKAILYYKWT